MVGSRFLISLMWTMKHGRVYCFPCRWMLEEAVHDLLHLLTPAAVSVNLCVEMETPAARTLRDGSQLSPR